MSVSAFRTRSMADAVSAGTLVVVEELVTPPPAEIISYISAAAEEDAVLGLFVLRSVPFSLGDVWRLFGLVEVCAAVRRQALASVVWVYCLLSPAGVSSCVS